VHRVRKQNKAMDEHKEEEAMFERGHGDISEKDERALLKKMRRDWRRKKK
jgi:hypothetical protein